MNPTFLEIKRRSATIVRGPPECVAPRGREMLLLIECSVCGRQACDGHAEGRAAHVVQTCVVAELHRRRFAAVFAADTAFEISE